MTDPKDKLAEEIKAERAELRREANLEGRLQGIMQVEFWVNQGFDHNAALYRALQDVKKEMGL